MMRTTPPCGSGVAPRGSWSSVTLSPRIVLPHAPRTRPWAWSRSRASFTPGFHAGGHEMPERRAVDDQLHRLDVRDTADALDVILEVAQGELGLVNRRLVEVVDDPVLLRLLRQVRGLRDRDTEDDRDDGDECCTHGILLR